MVDTIELVNPNDDIDVIEIGVAGPPGTGVTAAELQEIFNRLEQLEMTQNIPHTPPPVMQSGRYYGGLTTVSGGTVSVGRVMAANMVHAVPLLITEETTFDQVSLMVNVAGGSGAKVLMGIYGSDTAGRPATLRRSLGWVDVTATGQRTAPVSTSLPYGFYWLAGAANQTVTIASQGGPGVTAVLGHFTPDGQTPCAVASRTTSLSSGFTALPTSFGAYSVGSSVYTFFVRAA